MYHYRSVAARSACEQMRKKNIYTHKTQPITYTWNARPTTKLIKSYCF